MAKEAAMLLPALQLDEMLEYQRDIEHSLRLYFSPASPAFVARFVGYSINQINSVLKARLDESDVRSSLAVLTSIEAHFYVDFETRCRNRLKDPLSRHFLKLRKANTGRVRLDEDLLEGWKDYSTVSPLLIGDLRGAFKFRHWVAHGRYWAPKAGRKYDFQFLHLLATSIVESFPFAA